MVYHVNDSVAKASGLVYELNCTLMEIERGQEMLARVAALPRYQPIDQDILGFIQKYSACCENVSLDATEAFETIGSILEGLRKAVVKILEILKEVFRVLFDAQYRHRKVFLDMNRNLLILATRSNAVEKFESTPCTVMSQQDAIEAIAKSRNLCNLIRFVSTYTEDDAINELLHQYKDLASVRWDDGRLEDCCVEMTARKFENFREAGWSLGGLQEAITKHIDTITGIEILRETQRSLEKDITKLNAKITDAMKENIAFELVQGIQRHIALKVRVTKIVGAAIDILVRRNGAITTILKAIHGELEKVMKEPDNAA